MGEWYMYDNDEVVGPFSPDQLTNRIEAETLVCEAGSEEWQKAGTVDELASILKIQSSQPSPDSRKQQQTDAPEQEQTQPETDNAVLESDEDGEFEDENRVEPTLENLRDICERAKNDVLLEQYEEYWGTYDAGERRIILEEIQNRGLLEQT